MITGMKRRGEFEMIIDVLEAISEGQRKTTGIMLKANLPHIKVKKVLSYLETHGIIFDMKNEVYPVWSLTVDGERMLNDSILIMKRLGLVVVKQVVWF